MHDEREADLVTLAELVEGRLIGDGARKIRQVGSLRRAGPKAIGFFSQPRYRGDLEATRAGAVLLKAEHVPDCPTAALVVDNPYYAFAAVAEYLHPRHRPEPGIHPTATLAEGVELGRGVTIGAHVVVGTGVRLGDDAEIGAGSYLGAGSAVGDASRLASGVTLGEDCVIGARAIIHSGVVIGADGFGFAAGPEGWRKVPQLGRVRIGDDVEIGANVTIDRGALDDTIIEDGVKLDNLVHIAHNVRVGAGTIIAGNAVIAGSTTIGRDCQIGGASAITGHIEIADEVTIMGMSGVSNSIREPGIYASPMPAQSVREWRRNTVRFTQLDELFQRVKALERGLEQSKVRERR